MGDFSPLLTALWGVLLVFLVLLLARMVQGRRRVAVQNVPAPDSMVAVLPGPARRSPGRHSAAAPATSGLTILRQVPIAVRRRRRLDEAPALVPAAAEPVEDVAVPVEDVADAEHPVTFEAAAPAPSDAVAEDLGAYRRQVQTTIQAMSRRIGPGETPELVEARLLAAVDRLDGPVGFARPRLSPAGPHRPADHIVPMAHPVPPAPPAELPAASAEADPPAMPPQTASAAAEEPELESVRPEPPVPDDEVVLPVPPLELSSDVRRRGLRRRGRAG
nr:hypothetical protein [Aeromicrobium sp.]